MIVGNILVSILLLVCAATAICQDDELENLRYVAFGTSVSWGFGLPIDPDSRLRLSYIYRLSSKNENVKNLAIRASDARYASICTQSMVGNEAIYDVIVIEYDRAYYHGLSTLIQRLRQRFPQSIIILIDMFMYEQIEVIDLSNNNRLLGLKQYMTMHGYTANTPQSIQFLKDQSEHLDFQFGDKIEDKHSFMEGLANDYNADVYRWNTTTLPGQSMKDIIFYYLPFISEDLIHLNSEGHQLLASGIKDIIRKKPYVKTIYVDELGTWGYGDYCVTWFENGMFNDKAGMTRVEFGTSKKIDFPPIEQFNIKNRQTEKYALPFSNKTMINIMNPFPDERYLALAYMVMGPDYSIYPRTVSNMHNGINNPSSSELDTLEVKYRYPVHVIKTQTIGLLLPGINTIVINPIMENGMNKILAPFRLVGYSISHHQVKLIANFDFERGGASA